MATSLQDVRVLYDQDYLANAPLMGFQNHFDTPARVGKNSLNHHFGVEKPEKKKKQQFYRHNASNFVIHIFQ